MLVWGSSGKSRHAGDAPQQHCNVCGTPRPFFYQVNYTMRHVWYLFRWVTGRKYFQICASCQNGLPVQLEEINVGNLTGEKTKDPIPVFDRFGWVLGLSIVGVFAIYASIQGNVDDQEERIMLSTPIVGDVYTINTGKFLGSSINQSISLNSDFGAFRVSAVQGEDVILDIPKIVYSRYSGVARDIGDGKTESKTYYKGQIRQSISQLIKLKSDGAITDVDRPS